VPLARGDQDPGPAVLIAVILMSCARASAAPTPTSCGTGWPSRNRRARLVWRINPKRPRGSGRSSRMRSWPPPIWAQVKGGKPNLTLSATCPRSSAAS